MTITFFTQYVCHIGSHFSDAADKRALYIEGMNRIHLQERALLYRMLEGTKEIPGLRHIPNVEVYVDIEDRGIPGTGGRLSLIHI